MKKFIPDFILEKYSQKQFSGNFTGTILFADIVGFSSVTNELMKNGKAGAEVLADIITDLFSPSLNIVHKHNGFVISILGDAFIAVFWNSEDSINAAKEICNIFGKKKKQHTKFGNLEFSIKVGISGSEINWEIVKNIHQNVFVFKSPSLKLSSELQKLCTENSFLTDGIDLRQQPKITVNKEYSQSSFVPKSLIELETEGEFREVISCFVHFGQHQNLISGIIDFVQLYSGFIKDIDFTEKRIFVVFGAPTCPEKVFDSAINFTKGLQKKFNERLKFGLSYGTSFVGFINSKFKSEYVIIGRSVNFAARLVSSAKFGEILVDERMNNNISNSPVFIGKRKFKGFPQTVPVYRINSGSEIRLKASDKFIGRKKELKKLQTFINEVSAEKTGKTVYIRGAAGIGKSRLAAELRSKNQNCNWYILPCEENLQKSFSPIIHFFNEFFPDKKEFASRYKKLVRTVPNNRLKNELIRTESVIADLLNIRRKNSVFSKMDAKAKYTNTIESVVNFFCALSQEKPLILQLEDAHKADNDTKIVLQKLMKEASEFSLFLPVTCRQNKDGTAFELDLENTEQIELQPLQKEDVISFVGKNFDDAKLPYTIQKKVHDFCEGNPFYLEQLLIYLRENSLTFEDLNKPETLIPPNINSLIISRIDALSNDLKKTVKTASVLGREFAVNVLTIMLKELPIDTYLSEGENREIWAAIKNIKYIFRHSLIRESVYEMQLGKHLKKLHQLAATTYEELYPAHEKYFYNIAFHYEMASQFPSAGRFYEKAGTIAKDKYQNDFAIEIFQKILNFPEDSVAKIMKIDVLLKQAEVYRLVGKSAESKENLDAALILSKDNEEQHFRVILNLGIYCTRKGEFEKALLLYQDAKKYFTSAKKNEQLVSTLLQIGIVYTAIDKYNEAEDTFNEALSIAKKLNIAGIISGVYGEYGILLKKMGEYKRSIRFLEKKINLSESAGNLREMAYAYNHMGNMQMNKGEYIDSENSFGRALKLAEKMGNKLAMTTIMGNLGIIYMNTGRSIKALNFYRKSLNISIKIDDKIGVAINNGNMAIVLKNLGKLDEALVCVQKRIEINKELGDKSGTAFAYGNLGNIYTDLGNFQKAEDSYKKMLRIAEEIGYKIGIALAKGNLGNINIKLKKITKAKQYFDEAILLERELDLKDHLAQDLNNRAKLMLLEGNYKKAQADVSKVLILTKALNLPVQIFIAELTEIEIKFETNKNERTELLKRVVSVLENCEKALQKAIVHKLLYNLHTTNKDATRAEIHRKEALRIYKKLSRKNPIEEYESCISELNIAEVNYD